ncbi:hypothetical protein [Oceanobacillus neutriphilus]|uniref:DUF3829 domain-containing protein n=1 Tax=Oceanobacillus neutriphilus TaxID=531815 RepID=A0ABQ2P315_9BACI|nr:hypothetical protein [Oceanobacillus neutriphilus]GGP16879.1 hypothetical protein GCM10011346_50600 [Oceanobacillus neutriphilus]
MFKISTHIQQTTSNPMKTLADKNIPDKNEADPQAATITISDESQNRYMQSLNLKKSNQDDMLGKQFKKFYEEYHSAEAIEKRKLEQLEKEQAFNRLEDEFSIKGVQYHFPENTLQHTIKEALDGKVTNASLYAAELGSAIRSSVSMSDKSIEERAAYREMALKQAEYIAEHYFDDEQEAAAFMKEINTYYKNDVLREKGYVVFDNSEIEPFKNYSSPLSEDNDVSFYTLAKKYMDKDYLEQFVTGEGTAAESDEFLNQLQTNKEKYRAEIINEFESSQQQAEDQIKAAKSTLDTFIWENGLVTGTTEEQPGYLNDLLKWNKNMLNLFN